jgi:hypothetical protein
MCARVRVVWARRLLGRLDRVRVRVRAGRPHTQADHEAERAAAKAAARPAAAAPLAQQQPPQQQQASGPRLQGLGMAALMMGTLPPPGKQGRCPGLVATPGLKRAILLRCVLGVRGSLRQGLAAHVDHSACRPSSSRPCRPAGPRQQRTGGWRSAGGQGGGGAASARRGSGVSLGQHEARVMTAVGLCLVVWGMEGQRRQRRSTAPLCHATRAARACAQAHLVEDTRCRVFPCPFPFLFLFLALSLCFLACHVVTCRACQAICGAGGGAVRRPGRRRPGPGLLALSAVGSAAGERA